jgi:hypothetical protein
MLPVVEDADVVHSTVQLPVTGFNNKADTLAAMEIWKCKYGDGTEQTTVMM